MINNRGIRKINILLSKIEKLEKEQYLVQHEYNMTFLYEEEVKKSFIGQLIIQILDYLFEEIVKYKAQVAKMIVKQSYC